MTREKLTEEEARALAPRWYAAGRALGAAVVWAVRLALVGGALALLAAALSKLGVGWAP